MRRKRKERLRQNIKYKEGTEKERELETGEQAR